MAKTICQIDMTIIIVLSVVSFTTLDGHDGSHHNIDDINGKNYPLVQRTEVGIITSRIPALGRAEIPTIATGLYPAACPKRSKPAGCDTRTTSQCT
jgi:cytosine/uracil/thiamine/allantoin permease